MLDPEGQDALTAIVGPRHFLCRPDELVAYSYDATPGYQALPDAVVQPGSTDEVAAVLRLCYERNLTVFTRGSGTNLSGGTVPQGGGLVLALNRLNRILEIDTENLTVTVEPGVITAQIHGAGEAKGLFYPPDPGSMRISTIGGNIAENAGGLWGLKYGVTRDYVIGLEAVLPTGEILRTGVKNVKDVAGYDLTRLLVGSEGTLAVITQATLKLLPFPTARRTAIALFDRMVDAGRAVSHTIASHIIPVTLEFLDQGTLMAVEAFAKFGLPTDVAAVLLMEQDGPAEVCDHDIEAMAGPRHGP